MPRKRLTCNEPARRALTGSAAMALDVLLMVLVLLVVYLLYAVINPERF
jgi:K+-transporting ATPase KdpF subunit